MKTDQRNIPAPAEGQIVFVHGGVAQYRGGVFYTGMEDPRWERPIKWEVTWWHPVDQNPARWRPISEMHEDLGPCILIHLAEPGNMVVGNNLDDWYNEGDWTHFVQVPSLTHEEARRLAWLQP